MGREAKNRQILELWEPVIPEGGRRTSCSPAIKGELSRAELLELEEFGLN